MIRPASAALALLLLVPASAVRAQTTPDSPTVFKAGALSLKPMFAIKNIGRDNNVFNEADNPKSDFTMTLAPSAEFGFQPGRLNSR